MAINGVLRPGFVQIRVLDMPKALEHYIDRLGLHKVTVGSDGRVYLKAEDEFDHHSVVLRQSDNTGIDLLAFKVASEADLEHYEKSISDYGYAIDHVLAFEQPGIGRRLGFQIPSGHRIELYAHTDFSEPKPATHNPDIWISDPHGMAPQRFDHVLLYGPEIDQCSDFFKTVLGFKLVEDIVKDDEQIAVWLSCGMKAHDIAFVKHPEPGKLHHISFKLADWAAIGHAADIMGRYNISIDVGPTRHGVTRGQTIYFFDPFGNRNEVYAGGYDFYPDNPVRHWDAEKIGKAIFYYEGKLNNAFLTVLT